MYVEWCDFYHTESFVYLLLRSEGGIVVSAVIVVNDDDDDDDNDNGDGNGNSNDDGDGNGDGNGDSGDGGSGGDGNAARSRRGDFSIGGDVIARTADDTTSQTAGWQTM